MRQIVVLLITFVLASVLYAQDYTTSCFPPCRTGYICYKGECVSKCNPPCDEGEKCNDMGECIKADDKALIENVETLTSEKNQSYSIPVDTVCVTTKEAIHQGFHLFTKTSQELTVYIDDVELTTFTNEVYINIRPRKVFKLRVESGKRHPYVKTYVVKADQIIKKHIGLSHIAQSFELGMGSAISENDFFYSNRSSNVDFTYAIIFRQHLLGVMLQMSSNIDYFEDADENWNSSQREEINTMESSVGGIGYTYRYLGLRTGPISIEPGFNFGIFGYSHIVQQGNISKRREPIFAHTVTSFEPKIRVALGRKIFRAYYEASIGIGDNVLIYKPVVFGAAVRID